MVPRVSTLHAALQLHSVSLLITGEQRQRTFNTFPFLRCLSLCLGPCLLGSGFVRQAEFLALCGASHRRAALVRDGGTPSGWRQLGPTQPRQEWPWRAGSGGNGDGPKAAPQRNTGTVELDVEIKCVRAEAGRDITVLQNELSQLPSCGRTAGYFPSGTVGQWYPVTGQWRTERKRHHVISVRRHLTKETTRPASEVVREPVQGKDRGPKHPSVFCRERRGPKDHSVRWGGDPWILESRRHWLLQVVAATAGVWWTAREGRPVHLSLPSSSVTVLASGRLRLHETDSVAA